MKKVLVAILMAGLGVTSVSADNIFDDDENPGGWNFELPGVKVKKSGSSTEVTASLSSSFSFGFIGGVSQAKDVVENTGYDRRGIFAAAGALLLTAFAGMYLVVKKCFGREDSNI